MNNSRYLVIFEGNFNQLKSHFIGGDANDALDKLRLLPEEHFSRHGSTAIDCKFDSTLVKDISRVSRIVKMFPSSEVEVIVITY